MPHRTTQSKISQGPLTTTLGEGGEPHQSVSDKGGEGIHWLTTNHGVRLADNQNSLRAGARGPALLEDFALREKIFHFDHERIPERIVHARGSGAHGYFELEHPIPQLTSADIFQRKGERVPVFARFSTVAGGAGSADTPRDVRGFAVKFYTKAGNWDLVGNNIPVFFIQDAIKFPDLVHAVKMEADRGYPQAASAHDTFWDFASLLPETTHMLMWVMSDRTLPRSLRMMDGFGVHTFRLINERRKAVFVKFHWRPALGVQSTLWDEACKLAGADPDFHRRDLYEAIARGEKPEWTLGIQVFDEAWAEKQPYDVLDPTKLIPEEVIPVQPIGRMVLNRNVDNFFAETEQVAFLPTNIVPGIDFSNDPLLQGRLFSYLDTQKSRLGTTNFHQIPVNAPKCPFSNFQRDGMMQTLIPKGRANYEPNSLGMAGEDTGPRECPLGGLAGHAPIDERNNSAEKVRLRSDLFADHYSQARMFFRSQSPLEQAHIVSAFVFELAKVTLPHIRDRVVANLRNVEQDLAKRIAIGLGIPLPKATTPALAPIDMKPSPALSIHENSTSMLHGRCVAILVDEGSDKATLDFLTTGLKRAGADVKVVAPAIGLVQLSKGDVQPDSHLRASSSAFFDAIAILVTEKSAVKLAGDASAVLFVKEAYDYLKAVGTDAGGQVLLDKAGVIKDEGVTPLDKTFLAAAGRRYFEREWSIRALP